MTVPGIYTYVIVVDTAKESAVAFSVKSDEYYVGLVGRKVVATKEVEFGVAKLSSGQLAEITHARHFSEQIGTTIRVDLFGIINFRLGNGHAFRLVKGVTDFTDILNPTVKWVFDEEGER